MKNNKDEVLNQIRYFSNLFKNIRSKDKEIRKSLENELIKIINNFKLEDLEIFKEYYNNSYYIDLINKFNQSVLSKNHKGGVVILRYNLLKYLLNNQKLTSEIIDFEKDKIRKVVNKFNKNYDPFRSWKNDRVLYHFCYYPYKKKIIKHLKEFTIKLQTKLNIKDKTKINIIDFDGAQNQGYNHCWIAIYDKKFKSQQETKQIYVGFWDSKITFDIYEHKTKTCGIDSDDPRGEMSYEKFNFEKLINFFEDKKKDIFELEHLERELRKNIKNLKQSKKFTRKEKELINSKIYSEYSIFDSPSKIVKRKNHHYKIYNSLKEYFKKNFDEYSYEKDNVDITSIKDNQIYLFEIKPFENSKYTIRTALGQLLEYYYKQNRKAKYLCFVGINPLGKNKSYFDYLKNIFINHEFKLKYFYIDYEKKILIESK